MHNMPKAMEEGRRSVELAPKDAIARVNYSLYSCYSGDFQTCEREAHEVLKLNPSYEEGFLALAYAYLGQGQLPQAGATYQNLQKLGPRGASLAASGQANVAIYEGRYRQAVRILESGIASDVAAKQLDQAADKLAMLAYAETLRGDKRAALTGMEKALTDSPSAKIRFLAARTYLEAGETDKALKLATALGAELQSEPQAYAKIIQGEAALKTHNSRRSIELLTESKNMVDNWLVHYDLGLAYLHAEAFTEADSEFDSCIKRQGEILELFMDDMPTYSYFPPVHYYQGKAREGLKSSGAADSFRTYLSIRGGAGEDPLLPEVRHQLSQ